MLFLLDRSAHELARRDVGARRTFETMAVTGVLATCAIVELEILCPARNPADHRRLKTYLRDQCLWLETSDDTLAAAVDLHAAMLTAGMHRKPIADLIIASIAEAHDVVLVHHDRDFDDIATVATGLRTRWIVAPQPVPASERVSALHDSFTRPGYASGDLGKHA